MIAAVSDNSIRVWCAHTGTLLHLLRSHTQQAHVLEEHPYDHNLVLTAGYDGLTIIWDIEKGVPLKRWVGRGL